MKDTESVFLCKIQTVNITLFVYKKMPQGNFKFQVLSNVTYTIPQRFRCLACLHTVQTTDKRRHRGLKKSPNHSTVYPVVLSKPAKHFVQIWQSSCQPSGSNPAFTSLSVSQLSSASSPTLSP